MQFNGKKAFWFFLIWISWSYQAVEADDSTLERGLEYVQQSGEEWIAKRGCVSCHQVPSMIWSHEEVRKIGGTDNQDKLSEWKVWSTNVVNFVKPEQKRECDKQDAMASNIDTMVALLLAIPDENKQWRRIFANQLVKEQGENGAWTACGQLPAQRRSELETQATTTLWASFALLREEVDFELDAALAFAEKVVKPESSEFLAVNLLVAHHLMLREEEQEIVDALFRFQNEDGGWGWKVGEPSDALGTGYVLYALAFAGVERERLGSARSFLIESQADDGHWEVPGTKRSAKGRPTETAADWGSAWAVIGLAASSK